MTIAGPDPWSYVLDAWADPADRPQVDAFAVLGYEPNCLPRIAAAKAAGYNRSIDAARAGVALPAPCGNCPQERFHAATEDDVLFGGQSGGGKTRGLLMEGIRACVRYPGTWVAAYRRTYDELAESLLKDLAKLGYAKALGAGWNKTEKELTFPAVGGRQSKMRFRYAESTDDAELRQGGDYQLILVDERTLMRPGVVDVLAERLRSDEPETIPVLGLRSSANPGGASHGEVKARYIDATDHGAKVITDEFGRTRRFIQSRLADNPYLDADESYHRTLDAIPDPARRRAMKEGDWSVFAGQFFSTWLHSRHVVDPFPIPAEWEKEEGIDYGYAAPWAVAFMAFDGDGRAWMYNELYDTGVGATEQAERILAIDDDDVRARHADPSMWAKVGENNTIAETYAAAGCAIRKAVNDRVNGWARVHHYLAEMPACAIHRAAPFEWKTCPRLHVFSNCANLIRTLPNAPRDKNKPEDVDTNCDDHILDASRYCLMGRGVPFDPAPPLEEAQANAWDPGVSADAGGWDLDGYGVFDDGAYGR